MFFVLQVMFLSLGNVNKIQPLFSAMFPLVIVNGYNIVVWNDNRYVSDRINAIHYEENMYRNFNFNLLILLVLGLILPFFFYILSLTVKKYK